MGAALFSGRLLLVALLLINAMGFALGYIHWNTDDVKCFQKKSWQGGKWHTIVAINKLEFRYKTVNYDCDNQWKLDPSKFEKDSLGNISPK